MRFLIDENISPLIADALRAAGHDVTAAVLVCPGAPDSQVVRLAIDDARMIISEDKDFGELAFRDGLHPLGLVRLVLQGQTPAEKATRILQVLQTESTAIAGAILVVEPSRTRRRALP